MSFHLVALSGQNRGAAWVIDLDGLTLGRESGCNVILADPAVSRRHCRLSIEGDAVHFEDLGSRNLALVNGVPSRESLLHIGDEIAIGWETFLVTGARPSVGPEFAPDSSPDTESWAAGDRAVVTMDAAASALETRPHTIQDYAFVYEVVRDLSAALDTTQFLARLVHHLRERFQPLHLWIALVHGEDEMTFCDSDEPWEVPSQAPPMGPIRQAVAQKQGSITATTERRDGGRVSVLTLASPVVHRNAVVAALALQTEYPAGAYDEDDLRLLVCLAQRIAPVLCTVQHAEQLQRDNERLRARAGESITLVGRSAEIRKVREAIQKAGGANVPVIIQGETGTGKELVARMVHLASARSAGPFVAINCAAIPRELFESEIFGYEKGAFTGAGRGSPGLLTQAHGGTVFLDEIGDLALENQARILRAVEYGTFRRIGAKIDTQVDVRIIAATNKDLTDTVRKGTFREDLYHRLNGFEINVPPLRERCVDIPLLLEHFLLLARDQAKQPLEGIDGEVVDYLMSCAWPGNVRELRNWVFRAVVVARGTTIRLEDVLSADLRPASGRLAEAEPRPLTLEEMEKQHIENVLHQCGGSIKDAARVLQVARSTLYTKIAQYNIR